MTSIPGLKNNYCNNNRSNNYNNKKITKCNDLELNELGLIKYLRKISSSNKRSKTLMLTKESCGHKSAVLTHLNEW